MGSGRDEDFDLATDLCGVLFPGDLVLESSQTFEALLHNVLGHLIVHRCGGGPGADGVLESEGLRETRTPDDVHGPQEVLLGLAWEADDDVGGDRCVRDLLAHRIEDAHESAGAVGAAHGFEDRVRA